MEKNKITKLISEIPLESRKKIFISALKDTPNSIICKTGKLNAYRWAYYQGVGASPKDDTFDPKLGTRGGHKCCGSRVYWRHKVSCKNAVCNAPDDLSDLEDII